MRRFCNINKFVPRILSSSTGRNLVYSRNISNLINKNLQNNGRYSTSRNMKKNTLLFSTTTKKNVRIRVLTADRRGAATGIKSFFCISVEQ